MIKSTLPNRQSHKYAVLKLSLLLGALGWGMSFVFTFTGWGFSTGILDNMGAEEIAYQPMLNYWLKMASSAFGLIGVLFLWCFFRTEQMKNALLPLGLGSTIMGIVLTTSALMIGLKPSLHPTFIADISFCFIVGLGILYSLFPSDHSNE